MDLKTGDDNFKQTNYSFEEELQFPPKPKPTDFKIDKNLRQSYSLSSLEVPFPGFPGNKTLEEVSFLFNASEPSFLYHSSLISDVSGISNDLAIAPKPNRTNKSELSNSVCDSQVSEKVKTQLSNNQYFTENPESCETSSVAKESGTKKRYSDLSLIISKKLNKCINNIFNKSHIASRYSVDKRDTTINTSSRRSFVNTPNRRSIANTPNRRSIANTSSSRLCMNCSCHLQDEKPEPDSTNMIDLYPENETDHEDSSNSNYGNICNKKVYMSNVSVSFNSTCSDGSDNVFDKGFITSSEQSPSFYDTSILNKGFTSRQSGSLTRMSLSSKEPSKVNESKQVIQQAAKNQETEPSDSFMEKIFLDALILSNLVQIDDDELAENLSSVKPDLYYSSSSDDEYESKVADTKKYFPDIPPLSLDAVCGLTLKSNISECPDPPLPVVAPPLHLEKILPNKFREKRETIKTNVPKKNVPMKAIIPISKMITKIKGKGSSSKSVQPSPCLPTSATRSTPLCIVSSNEKDKRKKPAYISDTQSSNTVKRSFLPSPRQYPVTLSSSGQSQFGGCPLKRSPVSNLAHPQRSPYLNSAVQTTPITSTPVPNVRKIFSSLSPIDNMKIASGPRQNNVNTSYSGPKEHNSNYSKSGHRKSKSFGSFSSATEPEKPAVTTRTVLSRASQGKNVRDKENRHPSF